MAFRATGEVLQRKSRTPVAVIQVAPLVKVRNDLASLAQVTTDAKGHFEISIDEKQWKQFLAADDGAYIFFRAFRSGERAPIADTQKTVHWRPDVPLQGKEIVIEVDEPAVIEPPKPLPLEQLNSKLNLGISGDLVKQLNSLGIGSLTDIVTKGGLATLAGIPAGNETALKTLDAHANLSLVSPDPDLNAQLIAAGYSHVLDVALSPTSLFLQAVPKIDATTATSIHTRARVVERVLTNVASDARLRVLRGDLNGLGSVKDLFPKTCGCEDCQNAASPIAYLVDLLDYATRHVLMNGQAATLSALESRLHQPFRNLPATCAALDATVRQARICIEVLRQILPAAQRSQTPQWYLQAAFLQLLQGGRDFV